MRQENINTLQVIKMRSLFFGGMMIVLCLLIPMALFVPILNGVVITSLLSALILVIGEYFSIKYAVLFIRLHLKAKKYARENK